MLKLFLLLSIASSKVLKEMIEILASFLMTNIELSFVHFLFTLVLGMCHYKLGITVARVLMKELTSFVPIVIALFFHILSK